MIKLIAPSKLHQELNIDEINKKIKLADTSGVLKWHLEGMRFDQRFTKPINLSGMDILKILRETDQEVIIGTYSQSYFSWKFCPVNAFKPSNRMDVIKINLRQLSKRSVKEWEETMWHELTHIADHLSSFRFDHGENDLTGKEDSAPVKFARTMAALTLPKHQKGLYV